jgi:predicted amidohydrolase
MKLSIAIVQLSVIPSDPPANLANMEAFVARAANAGAQLVVFPEDAVTGPLEGQTIYAPYAPEYLAFFQNLAVRYGVDIVPGTWSIAEATGLHNAAYYINADGSVAGLYRKVNLWATEQGVLAPGGAASVFPTAHGMVGLTICWDVAFPPMFTEMARQGAEMVISPTYWSLSRRAELSRKAARNEIELIDALCMARAFENDVVFVYCNAAGTVGEDEADGVLSGRSQATHPHEKVLCKARSNKEEMLFASVSHVRASALPAV